MKLKGQGWVAGERFAEDTTPPKPVFQNSGKIEEDPKASSSSSQAKVFQLKRKWRRQKPMALYSKEEMHGEN